MKTRELTLKEISQILNFEFLGENVIVNGLNLCNRESVYESLLSYITSIKYLNYLRTNSKIKAVFVSPEHVDLIRKEFGNLSIFVVEKPESAYYKLHSHLYNNTDFYDHFNFKKVIGNNCLIHATASIEDGVVIGANVTIGPFSLIKKGSIIEDNVIIGCGSVIGGEGFQLIKDEYGNNQLIEHAGGCKLAQNVCVGDKTIICKSLFEEYTTIGRNTKIDNLVHVAHNCEIGEGCVLTAGVILSGSTIIKNNVWVAPNATILNKVVLENDSFVGIGAVVIRKVGEKIKVFGNPASKT